MKWAHRVQSSRARSHLALVESGIQAVSWGDRLLTGDRVWSRLRFRLWKILRDRDRETGLESFM